MRSSANVLIRKNLRTRAGALVVIEWIVYLFAHPVLALCAQRLNVRGIQGAHECQAVTLSRPVKLKSPFCLYSKGIFE
jgi:hypothetical protein